MIFKRFFGSKRDDKPPRDVLALAAHTVVPAARLVPAKAATRSHLGGTPSGYGASAWPVQAGRRLPFLARIDLAELSLVLSFDWLPRTGYLDFFYDLKEQPWGFLPGDRGRWRVIHVQGSTGGVDAQHSRVPALERRDVAFERIQSFPSADRPEIEALAFDDAESDAYIDGREIAFGDGPRHQVGGFPTPVQSDIMELQCQLASHGVDCGSPKGYESAEGRRLAPGAADWRLLLQIDTDEDLGVMWGDGGKIYFFVREEAARRGDFSDVWLVLQCT